MSRRRAALDLDNPGTYLKWAGNKGFLADPKKVHLVPMPAPSGRWREPCVGSAGLFFAIAGRLRHPGARPAVLTDINPRIVGVHVAVRDDVEGVVGHLHAIRQERHALEAAGDQAGVSAQYYRLRERFNAPTLDPTSAEGGALLIALNHLCVNGLYRENSDGDFNVSLGDYTKPPLFDPAHLRACSRALTGVDLRVLDCEAHCDEMEAGDSALLDPPYEPTSATAAFTGYSKASGNWAGSSEQTTLPGCGMETKRQRLARKLDELHDRGVRFVLTDSDTPITRALYSRHAIQAIQVPRSMSRNGDGRHPASELVVRNWQ